MAQIYYDPLTKIERSRLLDILGEDNSSICDIDGAIAFLRTIQRTQIREITPPKNSLGVCTACGSELKKWRENGIETNNLFCTNCDGH